jgi:lysophospholipase L1-like esterase
MDRESLLFTVEAGGPARAPLLFPPAGPVTLESATGEVAFIEGQDFFVDSGEGVLTLPPGSPVPRVTDTELFPASPSPDGAFMHAAGNPARYLLFAEGNAFHRRQAAATYEHDLASWAGPRPGAGVSGLARTRRLLTAGTPLTIWVLGDSISEGYNASDFTGAPPYQAAYPGLVASGLQQDRGNATLRNFARAGATASDGLYMVPRGGAAADLAIVAFGMNDAGYATPTEFHDAIEDIVTALRATAPYIEIILVSPMLPHPEWHYVGVERLFAYRDVLASLAGTGVALADVTTLWRDLLTRKRHHDLTGNGINHPNDFGHRVYADVILSLLSTP